MELSFGNGQYKSVAPVASSQEAINFRPNYVQTESGTTQVFLTMTEGILEVAQSLTDEINRGAIPFLGLPYWVQGNTFYRLDRTAVSGGGYNYSLVDLGEITGNGPVSMAINPTQICIVVPDGDAYIYTVDDGLELIDDDEFLGPSKGVIFVNGHFIYWTEDITFSSAINDGTTFNGIDFVEAEALPDKIVACYPFNNNIMVFGADIIERFQYTADDVGFPFTRIEGAYIQKGLIAQFAVVETDDTLIWLGGSTNELPMVWQSDGNTAWQISTPAIDDFIQNYVGQFDVFETAYFTTYSIESSTIACLNIGVSSLCFDTVASKVAESYIWHVRQTDINDEPAPWHVRSIIKVWNQLMTGDSFTNSIGILSNDVFEESGVTQIRVWSSANTYNNGDPIFIERVEVVVDAEVPNYTDDFLLSLDTSGDAGETWDGEMHRSVGLPGERAERVVWDRLGRFDTMVMFRLRWASNARINLIKFTAYRGDE